MHFFLMGFDQNAGVRLYAFQGISDGTRTSFTVGVDMARIPDYGIRIQELPLLCRGLLERRVEGEDTRTLTLTENEMRMHADTRAAAREAAAQMRKPAKRPAGGNIGAAWRGRPQ